MEVSAEFQHISSKTCDRALVRDIGKAGDFGAILLDLCCKTVFVEWQSLKKGKRQFSARFLHDLKMTPVDKKLLKNEAYLISREYEQKAWICLSRKNIKHHHRRYHPNFRTSKNTLSQMGQFLGVSGVALAALPLTIPVGAGISKIRSVLQGYQNEIICIPGEKKLRSISRNEVSIATFHLKLHESEMDNLKEGLGNSYQRAAGLARQLLYIQPSIICLQGVYHTDAGLLILVPRLAAMGYNVAYTVKSETPQGGTPGLLTASCFPIKRVQFVKYSEYNSQNPKGLLLTVIEIAKNRFITVANTLLEGSNDEDSDDSLKEVREQQLSEIKQRIENFCNDAPYKISNSILAGDFRIGRYTLPHYKSPYKAVKNPEYETFKNNLLIRSSEAGLWFKDLTYPEQHKSFREVFRSRPPRTENEHIAFNETGEPGGTLLESKSFTFRFFFEIAAIQVCEYLMKNPLICEKKIGESQIIFKYRTPSVDFLVEYIQAIFGPTRDKEAFLEIVGWRGKKLKWIKNSMNKIFDKHESELFRFPDCVDHICLSSEERGCLSERNYDYSLMIPLFENGIISNKVILITTLKKL